MSTDSPPLSRVALRAERLGKSYGAAWALRDVSLEVEAGESVALFGANGAGKSTLIRLLATLTPPTVGSLQILGHDGTRQAQAVRAAMGLLSHQSYLYAELTAAENLSLYARLYDVPDIEGRVADALEAVGLPTVAGKKVRELSRGMQQRLALARATIHRPALLLLDEPDSGLDEVGSRCLAQLVADGAEWGQTVVMSTHRLELGLSVCRRAVILARGKIAYAAPVDRHSVEEWRGIYSEVNAGHL